MPRPARKAAKRSTRAASTRAARKESPKQLQREEQENSAPSTPITGSPRYGRRIAGSGSSSRRLSLNSKVFDGLIDDLSPIKPGKPADPEPTLLTPQSPKAASEAASEAASDDSSDEFDIDALVLKSSTKKRRRNEPFALDILPQRTRSVKSPTPAKTKKTRASAKPKKPKAKKSKADDIWTAAGYVDDVDGYELAEEAA
ncbi:hypothetical protein LPJ78_004618 [Coemansia sp. RSA 989]|nr:hypothetical protein LPJ68_002940 [Coemansia sp. RSA 1086]KAJ1749576.1 hypothetical protein LPJ79_003614 [Coemansia sp. RSA 1821]KAJ1862600.1 hypothetical protein LPJ78_004618 [Coemansia sp. RSA 989]